MSKSSQNKRKENFYDEVWEKHKNIPIETLWKIYKHTLLSQYRHYNSAMLLKKANDIYSSFNSFFLSTEEGCKAFFIHQFLSARFENKEIPRDLFSFAFSKFFEHEEKWEHSINMLITRFQNHIESTNNEILVLTYRYNKIKNGKSERWKQKYRNEIEEFEKTEKPIHFQYIKKLNNIIRLLKKNNYFHLKNKSIYVDYCRQTHSFGFPEQQIDNDNWMQMKNIAGAMGEFSIGLLVFNNQKAFEHNLPSIDHKKFDLDYKYNELLKKE